MTGRQRSKGGCWTCKLRRKKCDEGQSSCAVCLSLDITCHGYGPKPPWMDGGLTEQKNIKALRDRVKEITNHRRKLRVQRDVPQPPQIGSHQDNDHVTIGPASILDVYPTPQPLLALDESYSTGLSDSRSVPQPPRESEDSAGGYRGLVQQIPTPSNSDLGETILHRQTPILCEEEAGLLVHYLDYVFPLQFPFYKHSAIKGGRGWLLAILMQLDPLYHAVLSVASYHMHFEVLAHEYRLRFGSLTHARDLPPCFRLEVQLTEHILSISRIGTLLQRWGDLGKRQSELKLAEYVDLIACMATLISLEVLKGDSDSWQVHLKAASSILPLAHKAFRSEQANDLSNTYKEAFRFFSAALTWYSIQSCMTMGVLSYTESADVELTSLYISISDFAGCDEWVIQEVLNIMELERWKETMKSKKQLSIRELTARALKIETCLKSEMSEASKSIERSSYIDFFDNRSDYIKLLVTRIFGYSALIYLYMIESGPCPDVPEIHAHVSKTIEAFKAVSQAELIRSLSWPLCIAGSMATGDQEAAFLDIAAKAKINQCPFGSSKHALAIIEECWRMRKNEGLIGENIDWRTAMRNLDLNILLV